MRIVPGQSPERALDAVKRHLVERWPPGVRLQIEFQGGDSPASGLSPRSPLVKAAERVLLAEHGRRPLHVRLGATVPITAVLKETMGVDTLMFGYNLPDEPVHAPGEFSRIASIGKGLRAWPRMLRELATFEPVR